MPRNEDGEFELLLGNRQVLSVFFIVVILLGVFFTMGYIVGRNSSGTMVADARKADTKSIVVEPSDKPSAAPAPTTAEPQPAPPKMSETTPAATQPVATPPPTTPEAKPLNPTAPSKQTEAPKPPEIRRTEPPARPAVGGPQEPQPGMTYLQVVAVAQPDAEMMLKLLSGKGFKAIYTPVPGKAGLYRVLVGPFKDAAAVAEARGGLQDAGLKPIVAKY